MRVMSRWADRLGVWWEWAGVAGVVVMVAVTCLDVLGAKLFLMPVPGATEIISLAQVTTMAFAVAATQRHRGHISVEMFVTGMNPRLRSLTRAFTAFLGLTLFSVLVVEAVRLGNEYLRAGEVTATVRIPFYPFAYLFGMALVPMAMMLLVDLVGAVKEALS
jgi:TRAP-type C4-dicarboxylate transport system permease small subunit